MQGSWQRLADSVRLVFDGAPPEFWPESLEPGRRAYLEALVGSDLSPYVGNVSGRLALARVGPHVVPLVIGGERRSWEDSFISSPTQYFVAFPREILRRQPHRVRWAPVVGAMTMLGRACDGIKLDRVVHIDHWLLTSQPACRLSPAELGALTSALEVHFPSHVFMVSHVEASDLAAAEEAGYRALFARTVYVWDPGDAATLRHRNAHGDFSLLRKTGLRRWLRAGQRAHRP